MAAGGPADRPSDAASNPTTPTDTPPTTATWPLLDKAEKSPPEPDTAEAAPTWEPPPWGSKYRFVYVSRFGNCGSSLPPKATMRMQAAAYREFLDHLTMWPRARFDLRARCPAGPVSRPLRLVARPQDDQDARCGRHAPEWRSALPGATARVGSWRCLRDRRTTGIHRYALFVPSGVLSGSMTCKSRKREGEPATYGC
jgi:hypothetical protein